MELIQTIDLLAERTRQPVDELSDSDFHICLRNMWFKHRNVKPLTYDIRKALFADALKPVVINWLEAAFAKSIALKGASLSNGNNIDGIISTDSGFNLVSVFIYSDKQFKHAAKNGLRSDDEARILSNLHHSSELSKSGNTLKRSIVIVVNRNDFDMFEMTIENDADRLKQMRELMRDAINDEAVPMESQGHHCAWCHYKDFCENNELASVNCRTCANYPCSFDTTTCGNHLYHPQLLQMAGHEYVAADQRRLRIDYGKFVNVTEGDSVHGRACFTSKELYKAAGKKLEDDPIMLELMERFDGKFLR